MDRVRFLSLPGASPVGRLIDQHEAILDAVERADVAASEAAMRTHLSEVLAALEPLRQRHPDLFEPDEALSRASPATRSSLEDPCLMRTFRIVDVRATTVAVPLKAALRHSNGCHWGRFVPDPRRGRRPIKG